MIATELEIVGNEAAIEQTRRWDTPTWGPCESRYFADLAPPRGEPVFTDWVPFTGDPTYGCPAIARAHRTGETPNTAVIRLDRICPNYTQMIDSGRKDEVIAAFKRRNDELRKLLEAAK